LKRKGSLAWIFYCEKPFDTSGKSTGTNIASPNFKIVHGPAERLLARLQPKNSDYLSLSSPSAPKYARDNHWVIAEFSYLLQMMTRGVGSPITGRVVWLIFAVRGPAVASESPGNG
jgi:hypothetical protein